MIHLKYTLCLEDKIVAERRHTEQKNAIRTHFKSFLLGPKTVFVLHLFECAYYYLFMLN